MARANSELFCKAAVPTPALAALQVDNPSLACKCLQLWLTGSVRAVHNSGSILTNPVYKFASAPYCSVGIQAYSCRVLFITRVTVPSILQDTPDNSVLEEHFIMAPILPDLTNIIQQKVSDLQPGNETQRLSLLQSARDLVILLEKPHERIMRMIQ